MEGDMRFFTAFILMIMLSSCSSFEKSFNNSVPKGRAVASSPFLIGQYLFIEQGFELPPEKENAEPPSERDNNDWLYFMENQQMQSDNLKFGDYCSVNIVEDSDSPRQIAIGWYRIASVGPDGAIFFENNLGKYILACGTFIKGVGHRTHRPYIFRIQKHINEFLHIALSKPSFD